MRYAIINKERCAKLGINPAYRRQIGDDVVITEKELSFSAAVGDTVEEKAKNENVSLITDSELEVIVVNDLQGRKEANDD